jgi:hypothetical protein
MFKPLNYPQLAYLAKAGLGDAEAEGLNLLT